MTAIVRPRPLLIGLGLLLLLAIWLSLALGPVSLPLADTLKHAQGGRALRTVDRTHCWAAQTPQMFRLGLLERALRAAGDAVTDEASAIEALGLAPLLLPCSMENLKVTLPQDFELAERLLRTR